MVVGISLIVLSAVFVWRHVNYYKSLDPDKCDAPSMDFFRAQLRRRMQTSLAIGVAGLAILVADWLRGPIIAFVYLVGLVLLVCWILMMALVDLFSTRSYLQQLRKSHHKQRTEMEREIERLRKINRKEGNGQETHP